MTIDLPTDAALSFGLLFGVAFAFGFAARAIGLPPMIGFLLAGVGLRLLGVQTTEALSTVADVGVTLLMFLIGLKLEPKVLLKPAVWGGGMLHALLSTVLAAGALWGLSTWGLLSFSALGMAHCLLLGFALAFSSTVFAAKTLESTAETSTEHGVTAIGILIVQDLLAVMFLTVSLGKIPSPWAFLLLLLFPLRPLLGRILDHVGHGDLLVACGSAMALFLGAYLFSVVGLKGDLGALVVGALLAGHPKAGELADALMSFKEVLLIGFFLNIGLSETITMPGLLSAALLVVFLPFKVTLLLAVLGRFRVDSHTTFRTTAALSTYSEFGLIVVALAVAQGWLAASWLVVLAIALTVSFIIASPLNRLTPKIEASTEDLVGSWFTAREAQQRPQIPVGKTMVFGMGRLGHATFDHLVRLDASPLGVDSDPDNVAEHQKQGRNVALGDATDPSFWRCLRGLQEAQAVVLLLPQLRLNRTALEQLRSHGYQGRVYALAHFPDEVDVLDRPDCEALYVHEEVGASIAARVKPNA